MWQVHYHSSVYLILGDNDNLLLEDSRTGLITGLFGRESLLLEDLCAWSKIN